jgi:hypothetical protein
LSLRGTRIVEWETKWHDDVEKQARRASQIVRESRQPFLPKNRAQTEHRASNGVEIVEAVVIGTNQSDAIEIFPSDHERRTD